MKGSVQKRCQCPPRLNTKGERLACKKDHGSWSYTVDLGRGPDGKRRQEKRGGFHTRNEAEEALTAITQALHSGTHATDQGLTLATWLDQWLEGKIASSTIRPGTAVLYEGHIRQWIKPELGPVRLRDLRVNQVQRAFDRICKHVSGQTTARVRQTLRSALNDAVRRQLISHNPVAYVTVPAVKAGKPNPWSAAELGTFLDAISPNRLAALFELEASTGMRRGEVCGLRWADIDSDQRILVVRQQLSEVGQKVAPTPPCFYCNNVHKGLQFGPVKTASGQDRIVGLDSQTVGVLLAHRSSQELERHQWTDDYTDHGLVFCLENGNPLRPGDVTRLFNNLTASAGLRKVRLHDLRHGAASLRLAAGIDPAVVSKALGHSRVQLTLDTYSHLLPGVAGDAAERANALIPRNRRDQSVTNIAQAEGNNLVGAVKDAGHSLDEESGRRESNSHYQLGNLEDTVLGGGA